MTKKEARLELPKMPEKNNEYVYQPPAKFTEELRRRINNASFSDEFKQQIKSAQKEEGRKMFERLTIKTDICIEPENEIVYHNPNDPDCPLKLVEDEEVE